MEWRELLYRAFPESFHWIMNQVSEDTLEDLHEYAVFLRSRFDIIRLQQQIENLGFVLENLIDTYDWDSRGAEKFLEWLNPFNDYLGFPNKVSEVAEEMAEDWLETGTVEEEAVAHLLARTESLPRLSGGRLECFDALDALQKLAVRRWLQEFANRYLAHLSWIARLELAMARLYWEYVPLKEPGLSIGARCQECWQQYSWLSAPSPWVRLELIRKSPQEAQLLYYGWYAPEEYEGFLDELAPSADLPLQERKKFTRLLSVSALHREQDWQTLYGWIRHGGYLADCLYTSSWRLQLHSPRLRKIIEQLGLRDKVRYIPVRLIEQSTLREVAVYYAAFYHVYLPCMSRKRTIGIWNEDFTAVSDLHRPALIQSQITGEELFVVSEHASLVVVSRRVRDAMIEKDILGCEFKPILVVDE